MATYVIGDVHGDKCRYFEMLQKIELKDTDKLIMIGDIIDRGHFGIDILLDIMSRNNVELVIGNHDLMMLDSITDKVNEEVWMYHWIKNGGQVTYNDFMERPKEVQNSILEYLDKAEFSKTINVNDRTFYIVHGGPKGSDIENTFEDDKYNVAWNRLRFDINQKYEDYDHIVFGHTCTSKFQNTEEKHFEIFHGQGVNRQYIGIDCGCGHSNNKCCLACIRLDDLKEFYVH